MNYCMSMQILQYLLYSAYLLVINTIATTVAIINTCSGLKNTVVNFASVDGECAWSYKTRAHMRIARNACMKQTSANLYKFRERFITSLRNTIC
jgi:hypothetical protein